MKIGSLCTGYGGLDMAVEAYFDAQMVWCAENDKQASQLIAQRFNKPNLTACQRKFHIDIQPMYFAFGLSSSHCSRSLF